MRLIQKKEETPSLSLWLSRDVPHERALAGELTERLGREKSLEYLLHLHDVEETRRQKRLAVFNAIALFCACVALALSITLLCTMRIPHSQRPAWMPLLGPLMLVSTSPIHLYNLLMNKGRRKKTPLYSSALQQQIITTLLDYADNPLAADALARALVYYTGDRDQLYKRLAQVLPLLPNDPAALTKHSRLALRLYVSPVTPQNVPEPTENLSVLRAAIADYFARTQPLVNRHRPYSWSKHAQKENDR